MDKEAYTVLLVSNSNQDGRLIRELLDAADNNKWHLEWCRQLSDSIYLLNKMTVDVILLDLYLEDSQGLKTLDALFKCAPVIPILILTDNHNEADARLVLEHGADEYLLNENLDSYWLPRILRNVILRKDTEDAMFIEKERAQVTLNSIGDAVLSTDINENVSYLNAVAEEMTGWTGDEAIGRPLTEIFRIIDGNTRKTATNPMQEAIRKNKSVGLKAGCILIRRDGVEIAIEDSAAPIHNRSGNVTGAVIVFHEASNARDVVKRMAHLAQHDNLTALPNRILFDDRIGNMIALAHRRDKQLAVLFLDIDNFKDINDSEGHSIGDIVLQSIAKILVGCVRDSDTVSRMGGDEFVILLSEIVSANDAALITEKILLATTAPILINDLKIKISLSIGISIYPDDGHDANTLIKGADTAMYHVKETGKSNYLFFKKPDNSQHIKQQFTEKQTVS